MFPVHRPDSRNNHTFGRARGVVAVNFGLIARSSAGAGVQFRASPIPLAALLLTFALGTTALLASFATKFVFTALPNIILLVAAAVAMDLVSGLAPQSHILGALRTIAYGLLYLVTTILCGIVAAYAMQRFAFPLQDAFLARADLALGLNWPDFAHWLDKHVSLQRLLHFAYHTISIQIALPLVVLAFARRLEDVRVYLLAFAIAFVVTIFVPALMPAAGPIVFVDREGFAILKFTGATPLDHLTRLREAGPLVFTDPAGGIATFPSFHATVAVLTPLTLRRHHRTFVVLLVLDAAMLAGTVTEGAHYYVDVLAGVGMAFFAYALARRIAPAEGVARQAPRQNGQSEPLDPSPARVAAGAVASCP
jgi:PAP2 superfamily